MRILFYTYTLDKDSGGALHSNMILVNEFMKKGYEVFIVIHKKGSNDIKTDCPILILDTNLGDLGRPFSLKRVIKDIKPHAVIANMKPQNINLSLAKLFIGKTDTKFIGVERNPDLQFRYGEGRVLFRKMMKKLYENLDLIIANSIATKEDLKKSFFVDDEKIKVIYNTVELSKIVVLADEDISEKEEEIFKKKTLINVGRLTNQKGQELLLKTFAKLNKDKYNLIIVGSGDRLESLQEVAKELNIQNSVYFLLHQNNPFKYIKRADLFVLTSHYEGFGRVVLESMALNTPVVAFDSIGGHNELLCDNNGYLVEYKNCVELAKVIENILNDKKFSNKLVENAKSSLHKYSLETHIENFEKVIVC